MRACWSHQPSRRPTAGEIVETLSGHPRLVSPCIDVPLASVQIERADDVELSTINRRPSADGVQSSRLQLGGIMQSKGSAHDNTFGAAGGMSASGAYSPMGGNVFRFPQQEEEETSEGVSDPLIEDGQRHGEHGTSNIGSYVQAGYILIDQN